MQVQFKNGLFSVTAENKAENETLFNLVNNTTTKKPEKKTVVNSKKKPHMSRVRREAVECEVDGCTMMLKNKGIHMRAKHGVDIHTGEQYETFEHAKMGTTPVSMPVVQLPNGTYKLRKSGGFLS